MLIQANVPVLSLLVWAWAPHTAASKGSGPGFSTVLTAARVLAEEHRLVKLPSKQNLKDFIYPLPATESKQLRNCWDFAEGQCCRLACHSCLSRAHLWLSLTRALHAADSQSSVLCQARAESLASVSPKQQQTLRQRFSSSQQC